MMLHRRARDRRARAAALGLAVWLMIPACATPADATRRDEGFARLAVPARVLAPPRAEEIVSRFDERIDVRALPVGPAGGAAAPSPLLAGHAGLRRLRAPEPVVRPGIATSSADDASPAVGTAPLGDGDLLADRHLRLVRLSPWRAGVEVYTERGLSLLVGAQSLVDESDRDPVTIEHSRSAFEGESLAIFGLRLRY